MVSGWGRTSPTQSGVFSVTSEADVVRAVSTAGPRGVLPRGLGRSYGDSAQDGGGLVLDMTSCNEFSVHSDRGVLRAQAGASMDEILRRIVPAGYFVPVTPGTRFVTVGGALASDIHGKNHHHDGSFGSHVHRFRLVTGGGEVMECGPQTSPGPFWATVGGMGLTGVVTEAEFGLLPIETSYMRVDTTRFQHLTDLMTAMTEGDSAFRYSVAWVDGLSATGRGVLTRGDHARVADLPARLSTDPLAYRPLERLSTPTWIPSGLLNAASVRAFNEAWYRKSPQQRVGEIQTIPKFFHPLDGVRAWNRVYGKRGFLQYQFVVPEDAGHVVGQALTELRESGSPSFLTVLKRFGSANLAPLSFPRKGWTLAADVPVRSSALGEVLDRLDRLVIDAGGCIYLAKDSRMSPATFRAGYPHLAEWLDIRQSLDPRGVFVSDQARRLGLVPWIGSRS